MTTLVAVLDIGLIQNDDIAVNSILSLRDVVADCVREGLLPEGQGRAVMDWIRAGSGATPRLRD